MRVFNVFFAILFQFLTIASHASSSVDVAKNEAYKFVNELYMYSPNTFEYGEFGKNGEAIRFGGDLIKIKKYQPERACDFLRLFFVEEMLSLKFVSSGRMKCKVHDGFARYPGAAGEDLALDSLENLPSKKISILYFNGKKSRVAVVINETRVVYYLVNTEKGWRIYNALIHEKWPEEIEDRCLGYFVLKPTAEELGDLAPHCRSELPFNWR